MWLECSVVSMLDAKGRVLVGGQPAAHRAQCKGERRSMSIEQALPGTPVCSLQYGFWAGWAGQVPLW